MATKCNTNLVNTLAECVCDDVSLCWLAQVTIIAYYFLIARGIQFVQVLKVMSSVPIPLITMVPGARPSWFVT